MTCCFLGWLPRCLFGLDFWHSCRCLLVRKKPAWVSKRKNQTSNVRSNSENNMSIFQNDLWLLRNVDFWYVHHETYGNAPHLGVLNSSIEFYKVLRFFLNFGFWHLYRKTLWVMSHIMFYEFLETLIFDFSIARQFRQCGTLARWFQQTATREDSFSFYWIFQYILLHSRNAKYTTSSQWTIFQTIFNFSSRNRFGIVPR